MAGVLEDSSGCKNFKLDFWMAVLDERLWRNAGELLPRKGSDAQTGEYLGKKNIVRPDKASILLSRTMKPLQIKVASTATVRKVSYLVNVMNELFKYTDVFQQHFSMQAVSARITDIVNSTILFNCLPKRSRGRAFVILRLQSS